MPNYRAVTNGNWSSLATWQDNASGSFVASTVLPGVNDDVYTNNFTVTINQNATVLSLRNTSATGITAGGRFLLTNGITVNATGTGLVGGSAILVEFNLAAPNSATLNYTLLDPTANNGLNGVVLLSGTGTLNCNGSFRLVSSSVTCAFGVTGNGVLNIVGNCLSHVVSSSNAINISAASATLNWTGSMPTDYRNGNTFNFITANTSTLNIIGNIYGSDILGFGTGRGITTNGICNITGIVEPLPASGNSGNIPVIVGNANSVININGILRSNTNRSDAISTSGLINMTGQIICINDKFPISANRLRLLNATPTQITFQTDINGINKTLYQPGTALGNPATTDVRQGVSYASGALTGTLVVPNPSNVRQGVPTDNTVGTAALTPADFWDYLTSAATTPGSLGKAVADNLNAPVGSVPANTVTEFNTSSTAVAVRMRNVSTVDTTGNQIAAAL